MNGRTQAQFTHDITFDVFRFMRDHEIAYGFNEALLDKDELRTHSRPVISFIDKHPDLLHADADLSWLLDYNDGSTAANIRGNGSGGRHRIGNWWAGLISLMMKGSLDRPDYGIADRQQDKNHDSDADEVGSPAEAFAS